jgi:hypothetical protein
LFEQNETVRLTQLNEQVKKGGPLSSLGCLGFIITASVVGGAYGAGTGWGTIILGLFVVGAIASAEEQFRRWRYKMFFVRREFEDPEPIYRGPQRQEPPTKTQEIRITSLRQEFEVLELPPGKITLGAARAAYKRRMLDYHPDRVQHLGPELRELANRKALKINLASQFIQQHCK